MIISKLRHPWDIVYQNYNLEWPLLALDIITPELECEEMDKDTKTTPYVGLK